jgi:hypothetical protein
VTSVGRQVEFDADLVVLPVVAQERKPVESGRPSRETSRNREDFVTPERKAKSLISVKRRVSAT